MNINIKTTNTSLTPAIESYLTKKLQSISKIIDLDADNVYAQVELGRTTRHHKSGEIFRAEINLRFGNKRVRVTAEEEDLYAAIDTMKDELVNEVKAKKEKTRALQRKGNATIKDMVRGIKPRRK
jgi:ribosomal subunit interface protein